MFFLQYLASPLIFSVTILKALSPHYICYRFVSFSYASLILKKNIDKRLLLHFLVDVYFSFLFLIFNVLLPLILSITSLLLSLSSILSLCLSVCVFESALHPVSLDVCSKSWLDGVRPFSSSDLGCKIIQLVSLVIVLMCPLLFSHHFRPASFEESVLFFLTLIFEQ